MLTSSAANHDDGPTLGLIVNPVAGMGGSVGLKGTDGLQILQEARRRGAQPTAGTRARLALARLAAATKSVRVLTGSDAMGENDARAAGFEPIVIHRHDPDLSLIHI